MTATGNNYAEALFMLAREENNIDNFYEGLKIIEGVLEENPQYLQFLSTPSIPKNERTSALTAAFDGKVNEHILSFMQLLCEHGKVECFSECVAEFDRLREWSKNTVVALVKTATELTEAQKQSLVESLQKRTGKTVVLNCVIDNTLIGGITVEINDELFDGSVRNNLKRAKEVISE